MIFGSVCSGIEAASAAWHPLGWQTAFVSEIEPFPCAVLNHHYPEVPNYGDMTKFQEWPDAALDVLVGGTPCQSFSVAGLRKGLADPRGNLMLTYLAIADQYRPDWLVWENVPGVLSSNGGRDFASFLRGLAELGYGFAYRILDAQYFGVAQRRRRVFVVGHIGDWRRAAAVLFERHSLQGHPAPRREAGKRVAGTVKGGSGSRGYPDPSDGNGGGLTVAHSLRAQAQASFRADTDTYVPIPHAHVSPAIKARDSKGVSSDGDGDGAILVPMVAPCLTQNYGKQPDNSDTNAGPMLVPMVSHSLRGDGFDASEDGTGRGTPLVCAEVGQTLTSGGRGERGRMDPVNTDLVASFKGGQGSAAGGIGYDENVAPTLGASPSGSNRTPALMQAMQVRRLTPRECERLQGFPDDYTLVQHRNKPAADGPRYKALGNSMAVPVMAWIGKRIQMVEDL